MPAYRFTENDVPEYLHMFSNSGPLTIKVRFTSKNDRGRKIAELRAEWTEIAKLFNEQSGQPFNSLRFDSYLCPISKTEVTPQKNLMVIHVGGTSLPSLDTGGIDAAKRSDFLDDYDADYVATCEISLLKDQADKSRVDFYCMVDELREICAINGKRIALCSVSDGTGSTEVVVFADLYDKVSELLRMNAPLFVTGTLETGTGEARLMAEEISLP